VGDEHGDVGVTENVLTNQGRLGFCGLVWSLSPGSMPDGARVSTMADQPSLVVQLARGGAVDRVVLSVPRPRGWRARPARFAE
jgi:hypothetical protein